MGFLSDILCCFSQSLSYPVKIMENRSSQLKIENRSLQVIPNAKTSNIIVLTDTLNSFDLDYNLNANTKPLSLRKVLSIVLPQSILLKSTFFW